MEVENERVKYAIRLIVGIAVLTVVVFVWDLIVNRKSSVKEIISNITPTKVQDTYNGVYTYSEDLGYKVSAFTGCSFSAVDNYILVINDDFYLFRSTCMGTYLKGSGKTDDLNIVEEKKSYSITYKDNLYHRDYKVVSIVPNNNIAKQDGDLDLNSIVGIAKETEFEGNYYSMERRVYGTNGTLIASFKPLETKEFQLTISSNESDANNEEGYLYTYTIDDLDRAPVFYTYGKNLVIIERDSTASKYAYKFLVVNGNGDIYDYANYLPVKIDDQELNYSNNSIFIVYDKTSKYFKIFLGKDKKFCKNDDTSDEIAFYEYSIKYNYTHNEFDKPEFVKIWRGVDGCSYIDEYLKEAV